MSEKSPHKMQNDIYKAQLDMMKHSLDYGTVSYIY